jgi:hypothetical protein
MSSVSSVSSESSESSIETLPEYEDLREDQLAVFLNTLRSWVARGSPPMKDEVKQFKKQLKEARRNNTYPVDKAAVKKELRPLLRQLVAQRKQARQAQRREKRERRQRNRAEKRERRLQRREMKRAEREYERARRHCGDHGPGNRGPHPMPHVMLPMPPIPQIPPVAMPSLVPPVPPVPSIPPVPPVNPWHGPGPWGGDADPSHGRGADKGMVPGAWPENRDIRGHEKSAAMYQAASGIEKDIERKLGELQRVEELRVGEKAGEASPGGKCGSSRGCCAREKSLKGQAQGLEKAIDALQTQLEKLILRADEEYAKELQGMEDQH